MADMTVKRFKPGVRWQASMLLVSLLIGMMVTIQYTGSHRNTPVISTDTLELKTQLLAELEYSKTLDRKIIDLQNEISQYQKSAGDTERLRAQISEELDHVRQQAALTPLKGPGVTLTLTRRTDWYNQYFLAGVAPANLRLDEDHLGWLTALLFSSGAQGIAINNYRISNFSTIRSIGSQDNPQLQVNGRPVSDPYVIKVVGNVDSLKAGLLNARAASNFQMIAYELSVTPSTDANPIELPPYDESSIEIRAAKVDTQGERK